MGEPSVTESSAERPARPAKPSIAELRAVVHPEGHLDRRSGEHWAGRWYMRRISLRVTRLLLDAPVSPNQLTMLMLVCGVAAGAAFAVPGPAGAVAAAVGIQ